MVSILQPSEISNRQPMAPSGLVLAAGVPSFSRHRGHDGVPCLTAAAPAARQQPGIGGRHQSNKFDATLGKRPVHPVSRRLPKGVGDALLVNTISRVAADSRGESHAAVGARVCFDRAVTRSLRCSRSMWRDYREG